MEKHDARLPLDSGDVDIVTSTRELCWRPLRALLPVHQMAKYRPKSLVGMGYMLLSDLPSHGL